MKKIIFGVLAIIALFSLVACGDKKEEKATVTDVPRVQEEVKLEPTPIEEPIDSGDITINVISDLANAKILGESKELTDKELPTEIKPLAELFNSGDYISLDTISALYVKSDYTKEEFDILHDYVLLYSEKDGDKIVTQTWLSKSI